MASYIKVNLDTSKKNKDYKECNQYDDLILKASIFENELIKNVENAIIIVKGVKSDNTFIIQTDKITKKENEIKVELNRDFTRIPGETEIQITLNENEKNNTIFSFNLKVNADIIGDKVESKNLVTTIEGLKAETLKAETLKGQTEILIPTLETLKTELIGKIEQGTTLKNETEIVIEQAKGIKAETEKTIPILDTLKAKITEGLALNEDTREVIEEVTTLKDSTIQEISTLKAGAIEEVTTLKESTEELIKKNDIATKDEIKTLKDNLDSNAEYVTNKFNNLNLNEYDNDFVSANKTKESFTVDLKLKGKTIQDELNGIKSVGEDNNTLEIKSIGKNLFNGYDETFSIASDPNNDSQISIDVSEYLQNLIGLTISEGGLTFKADVESENLITRNDTLYYGFDINFVFSDGTDGWNDFTRPNINCDGEGLKSKRVIFNMKNHIGKTIVGFNIVNVFARDFEGKFKMKNIEIMLGNDTNEGYTPYEEDKQTITLSKPLLSLPNEVCDEVDLEKGKLIERVGKIVLNGSENWRTNTWNNQNNTIGFEMAFDNNQNTNFIGTYSDKLVSKTFNDILNLDTEGLCLSGEHKILGIKINRDKLNSNETIEGIKEWLRNNPITLYHKLETPIETPLDIQIKLKTYDKGTNITTNGSDIKPNVYCKIYGENEWIEPTLINGWKSHEVNKIGYMKDSLGFVHLKGRLTGGSYFALFTLPSGYNSNGELGFSCTTSYNSSYRLVVYNENVYAYGYAEGSDIYLDGVIFQAEQ